MKPEYPGFILWWQDHNRYPLSPEDHWLPWYLWPEDSRAEPAPERSWTRDFGHTVEPA